jgi:hypothetical protein
MLSIIRRFMYRFHGADTWCAFDKTAKMSFLSVKDVVVFVAWRNLTMLQE